MNRRSEAVEAFERALRLDPHNFDACLAYARFCVTEEQTDKAIELFVRAIEAQPDDPQAALLLHSILHSKGRDEEAERYGRLGLKRAEEALRLHPESSRPAQLGACTLATMGEKQKSRDWLEHALSIDPDDANARYNAACTYALLGDADRSIDLLEAWTQDVGPDQKIWFLHDADLDPIRGHPRYAKLLELIA